MGQQWGDKEVTLSWTAPANNGGEPITGYEYTKETTSGAIDRTWTATRGTGTTFTVTPLVNGETYYFTVRARNSNGQSLASEEASATLIGRPGRPMGLMAEAPVQGGEVELTWTPPPADDIEANSKHQYQQRAGTGSYGNWIDIPNSGPSTASYSVTGLDNGTTYTFQVRAVNLPDRESLASGEASATPRTTPGPPILRATAGDKQMTLSWTAPSDDGGAAISHYVYEVRTVLDIKLPTASRRSPFSPVSRAWHTAR